MGRRSAGPPSRLAERRGLIPHGETVLGQVDGVAASYRNAQLLADAEPTTLVLTPTRLVVMADKRAATADLAGLYEIEPLPERDRLEAMRVTAVSDLEPAFRTWTFSSHATSDFLVALRRAAAQRRAESPQLVWAYAAWAGEIQRRDVAAAEINAALGAESGEGFLGAVRFPVLVRTLADEPAHARFAPMVEVSGTLSALRDRRLLLATETDGHSAPIALFRNSDVTYLTFPAPAARPSADGVWEIGFRAGKGERRVLFRGPGPSLSGRDGPADALLGLSGLLARAHAMHYGTSWQPR